MNQQTLQSTGLRRLAVLFIVAIFITLFVSNGALAGALFQSPVSPVVEEVAPVPLEPYVQDAPVEQGEVPAEGGFQPEQGGQPEGGFQTEPQPEVPSSFGEAPAPVPNEEPVVEPQSGFGAPVTPDEPIESDPAVAQPPAAEPRSVRLGRDDASEDGGSPNFILDQAELIDTVVVSTAYVWLCCGIGLFLLIPLVFLFLQIRGRTKIIKEEIY